MGRLLVLVLLTGGCAVMNDSERIAERHRAMRGTPEQEAAALAVAKAERRASRPPTAGLCDGQIR
jgi:hypothetical protein